MCQHIILLLPNRPGQMHKMASLLSEAQVNILGYGLSSEGRVGFLYLLCSPHRKAFEVLSLKYKFYCSEKEVQIAKAEHTPGTLAPILKVLAEAVPPVNLPTSYQAVSQEGRALVVMEFDSKFDNQRAKQLLTEKGIVVLDKQP